MKLVLATSNLHKVREFREILKDMSHLDIFSLQDFPDYTPPEETGSTFEENAILKAVHAAKAIKEWILADDSGLVVPILGGAPGVLSRRYASEEATDAENRDKLLEALSSRRNPEQRAAYFECSLALADAEGLVKCVSGRCEGTITFEERGTSGFGYDPIFVKHDYDKTFAELDDALKNRISHRRKAFDKMKLVLENASIKTFCKPG